MKTFILTFWRFTLAWQNVCAPPRAERYSMRRVESKLKSNKKNKINVSRMFSCCCFSALLQMCDGLHKTLFYFCFISELLQLCFSCAVTPALLESVKLGDDCLVLPIHGHSSRCRLWSWHNLSSFTVLGTATTHTHTHTHTYTYTYTYSDWQTSRSRRESDNVNGT